MLFSFAAVVQCNEIELGTKREGISFRREKKNCRCCRKYEETQSTEPGVVPDGPVK